MHMRLSAEFRIAALSRRLGPYSRSRYMEATV